MKVLAIDPGYGRCGVAVLERIGGKDVLHYSNCIETSAETAFEERLSQVFEECERLVRMHAPDCLAIEKLFFSANRVTAMKVAEVRGAILSLAGSRALSVHEYTPGEVKSATAGHGGADKKTMARMIRLLVKIEKPIRHDDEYDAIAIGLTHLASARVLSARHAQTSKKR